ncbi:hypothetical protein LC612_34955, partial [Nostoc sp. CHAB 5834]|nr:hypothetical protein [Nostoc sp. CHAB 5834]
GIESGRFSVFPGLGIQILRVGLDLPFILSPFARFRRASGDKDYRINLRVQSARTQITRNLGY